jgi:hypothetical protein
MLLHTLIQQHTFVCPESRDKLLTALEARKPLVAFDVTCDELFYKLFDRFRDREFVGLTPGDYDALSKADDIRTAGKSFLKD